MKFIVNVTDDQAASIGNSEDVLEAIKDNLEFVFDGEVDVKQVEEE